MTNKNFIRLHWFFYGIPLSVDLQMKFTQSPQETSASSVFYILDAAISHRQQQTNTMALKQNF